MEQSATDLGICCSPGCGVVLQSRRECPICKKMNIQGSYFCSHDCYKKNWKIHKLLHDVDNPSKSEKAAAKNPEAARNATEARVIAVSPGDAEVSLVTLMSSYDMKGYGNYGKEKEGLRLDLGWKSLGELKFYPKTGCQWYYFGYYDLQAKKKGEDFNKALSQAAGCKVYGKVLVLPSGPIGNGAFYEDAKVKFVDLAETLAFYRDNNPKLVFQEREAQRSLGPAGAWAELGADYAGGKSGFFNGQPVFSSKLNQKGQGHFKSFYE